MEVYNPNKMMSLSPNEKMNKLMGTLLIEVVESVSFAYQIEVGS